MGAHILKFIEEYINDPINEYAILLDGDWGAGKTYYWENTIKPFIKSKDIKTIYISLYGLTCIQDVGRIFFLEKYTKKHSKYIEGMLRTFPVVLDKFSKIIDLSNHININNSLICFDDLERSGINIIESMAFINMLVEHSKAKVLLIANENKIDPDLLNKYRPIKEKTIGKTIKYNPNFSNIVTNIISKFKEKYCYKFLRDREDIIISIAESSKYNNIRTLNIALSFFSQVYNAVLTFEGDIIELYREQILVLVLSFLFEIMSPQANKDTETLLIDAISKDKLYKYLFEMVNLHEENSIITDYYNKYYKNTKIRPLNSMAIVNYLLTSTLDSDLLKKELSIPTSNKDNTHIFNITSGYGHLSDEDFENSLALTMKDIKKGGIANLNTYVMLYMSMTDMIKRHLIKLSKKELVEIFKDGIQTAIDNNNITTPNSNLMLPNEHDSHDSEFMALVKKTHNQIKRREKLDFFLQLQNSFCVSMSDFRKKLNSNHFSLYILRPFLNYFNPKIVAEAILSYNNDNLLGLTNFLEQRYQVNDNVERLAPEYPFFDELIQEIGQSALPTEKLRNYHLNTIEKKLIEIRDALQAPYNFHHFVE